MAHTFRQPLLKGFPCITELLKKTACLFSYVCTSGQCLHEGAVIIGSSVPESYKNCLIGILFDNPRSTLFEADTDAFTFYSELLFNNALLLLTRSLFTV